MNELMNAKELLSGIKVLKSIGPLLESVSISGVASDSRDVKSGVLFVSLRGSAQDGHNFIESALKKKAAVVVLEDASFMPKVETKTLFILVENSKKVLESILRVFYGDPFRYLRCVGITGTNGKTTVSYLVRSILNVAGLRCALIGTIGYKITETNIPSQNTTPGVVELYQLAAEMVKAGNKCVAMEVSSHALDQERVAGIVFRAAIFTNLTQDHLDYHKNMEEYFSAKQKLFFDYMGEDSYRIINIDDAFGNRLFKNVAGPKLSCGFSDADICVASHDLGKDGSRCRIKTPKGEIEINTKLVGKHNIYNILCAVALGISQELSLDCIRKGIEALSCVPGRLERIDTKTGFSVFIDYAHTDDAIKNVLESLRSILHNGRIITVFGCGGDRDKGKRPKMGQIASALSDRCIITSDNPRSEDPQEIARQITSGLVENNFEIELDRQSAIRRALKMAQKNDFVLVAGKGHETYQIIKDKILPFDDKAAVLKELADMKINV